MEDLKSKIYGSIAAYNADPFVCEEERIIEEVAKTIQECGLQPAQDFATAVAKLDLADADNIEVKQVFETPDGVLTICFNGDFSIKDTKILEQALINYAINEASIDDVAQILNVDADAIADALLMFKEEWDVTEEPEDADDVIDNWVEFLTAEHQIEDVELMKGSYNTGDTLTWVYDHQNYSCTGEFYVDKDNRLHHTFIAPNGKEIEIVTPYEI